MMMFNKASAKELFHHVNVTGRFQDRWLTTASWTGAASAHWQRLERDKDHFQQGGAHTWRKNLSNAYTHARFDFAAGAVVSLQARRFMWPLYVDTPWILLTQAATDETWFGGYPVFELLIGRGHDPTMAVSGRAPAYVQWMNEASQWGVAGYLFERPSLYMAQRAEDAGYDRLATACYLGATVARVSLQPLRAVVAAWALADTCLFGALYVVGISGFHTLPALFRKHTPPARQPPPMPAADARRPPMQQDRVAAMYGVDVHAEGRPRRVQRAVSELRAQHQSHELLADTQLLAMKRELQAFLREVDERNLLPGRAPCGLGWTEAARRALDKGAGSILDHRNLLLLPDENDAVCPVAHVAALFWDCLAHGPLRDCDRPEQREERKLAFVKGLARCLFSPTSHYCATGQAQRLLMPLQGFVGDFNIDIVNDAPPAVHEFIVMELSRFSIGGGEVLEAEAAKRLAETIRANIDATYETAHDKAEALNHLDAFMQLTYPELAESAGDQAAEIHENVVADQSLSA